MSRTDSHLTASPRRWILVSAWATVAHVLFQLAALVLAVDGRSNGWSVSTIAQTAITVLLAVGAFRRNVVALVLLGLLGGWRLWMFAGTIARVRGDGAAPLDTRLIIEYAVTIPIALLWVIGAISAIRALRDRDNSA